MIPQGTNLYNLSYEAMHAHLKKVGGTTYHGDLVWHYLYRQEVQSVDAMHTLRQDIRESLQQTAYVAPLKTSLATDSGDGFTRKYLLECSDGQLIETVQMAFKGRWTACVSTQVGCAMGCVFCATGQMGFTRHLTAGEIVAQVLYVNHHLRQQGTRLRNIVLMGMGEPLHNYDATLTAVDILINHKGLAIAPKHITLSTVGVVPGIIRLADEQRAIRLAVSLHGATDEERRKLVPLAHRWPLGKLIDACKYYTVKRNRNIFFEWTLIEGENDQPEQAHALGNLLKEVNSHINLIPLNPTHGYGGQPTKRPSVKTFQAILTSYGIPSTVRQRRGIDIAAGCGQLKHEAVR